MYFWCGFSASYGTLYGMYYGDIQKCTLGEAKENARECALDAIESYDCIMSSIYEFVNEKFDFYETPDDPNEEYLDALESAIQDEVDFVIFRVTEEGENHIDEMEDDYADFVTYQENGWLVPVE